MTKMSCMPCLIDIQTNKKSLSLELMGQSPLVLVCNIMDMDIAKFVQMLILVDLDIVKPFISYLSY